MMSIDSLGVKCLCKVHNEKLSDIDQAAIDTFNTIRRLCEIRSARQKAGLKRKWRNARLIVDGRRFERWMLKTAINLSCVLKDEAAGWTPSREMVEVVFGRKTLPEGVGMGLLANVGETLGVGEMISCSLLHDKRRLDEIVAGLFMFGGYNFVCSWELPVNEFIPFEFRGTVYKTAVYHIKNMDDTGEKTSMSFDWSGNWSRRRNNDVVRLRSKYKSPPR